MSGAKLIKKTESVQWATYSLDALADFNSPEKPEKPEKLVKALQIQKR